MPLPMPDQYDDWRDWASAIMQVLGAGDNEIVAGEVRTIVSPAPAGYHPVWMNDGFGTIWAGNPYGTAPVAADLVFIDTAAIADAAIETQKVADLAINTAKIGNAAIVSAKIGDLQVVTAKIADLAVNNAKIANLAVASANIQDLAVTQAKIGLLAVGSAQIIDLAVGTAKIADASILTAKIGLAQVGTAQIAAASITTALIQNAAIVQALIGAAAIGTAQIQDAAISSAKIINLVVDKITAGTLNAEIDMGTGLIRFTIGGFQLTIGKGFGTSAQFIMWYGPAMAENLMSEASATFYLTTTGDAYFGGNLLAGVLRTAAQTTDTSTTAQIVIGDFASNGNVIQAMLSYAYVHSFSANHGTGAIGAGGAAQIVLEASTNSGSSWTTIATLNLSPTKNVIVDSDPAVRDQVEQTYGGSTTVAWSPGVSTTLQLRGRVVSRTEGAMTGTGIADNVVTQNVAVSSTEQP